MSKNRINRSGMSYRLTEVFGPKNQTRISLGNKSIIVDHHIEKLSQAWYYWNNGAFIQEAFSFLTADEREFLQTGMTAEDWALMSETAEDVADDQDDEPRD